MEGRHLFHPFSLAVPVETRNAAFKQRQGCLDAVPPVPKVGYCVGVVAKIQGIHRTFYKSEPPGWEHMVTWPAIPKVTTNDIEQNKVRNGSRRWWSQYGKVLSCFIRWTPEEWKKPWLECSMSLLLFPPSSKLVCKLVIILNVIKQFLDIFGVSCWV